MNKKYETLLDLANNVCDGVRNYYSATNEIIRQKLYMFVWEQVYILAQLLIDTIRYTQTNKKDEASGSVFVSYDCTVCKHTREVVEITDGMHEAMHKAVEQFMKKLLDGKIEISHVYAEAKIINFVKALIVGNLNNLAKQAERDVYKYREASLTIAMDEMVEDGVTKNDMYIRNYESEYNQEKKEILEYVVSEFVEILYVYLHNHPEDEVFIQERYLAVLVDHNEMKKGKDIAKVLHISPAAVSKKIAKYDAYFSNLLIKRVEQWV